jgi:E3 ubiquitin-protein ligase DOA10
LGGTEHVLDEAAYCRICLETQQDANPLLNVCQCRDQIHQQCLLEWVEHRMEGGSEAERLACEICKAEYSVALQV